MNDFSIPSQAAHRKISQVQTELKAIAAENDALKISLEAQNTYVPAACACDRDGLDLTWRSSIMNENTSSRQCRGGCLKCNYASHMPLQDLMWRTHYANTRNRRMHDLERKLSAAERLDCDASKSDGQHQDHTAGVDEQV